MLGVYEHEDCKPLLRTQGSRLRTSLRPARAIPLAVARQQGEAGEAEYERVGLGHGVVHEELVACELKENWPACGLRNPDTSRFKSVRSQSVPVGEVAISQSYVDELSNRVALPASPPRRACRDQSRMDYRARAIVS